MGNITKPRLTAEDIKLLQAVAKHGFVDMCYIFKFYKRGCKQRTIEDRVLQLSKHKYLYIERMFQPADYVLSGKTGYKAVVLGKLGLEIMGDAGYDVIDNRATVKNAASYRVYHQVQVATVCDSIKETFQNSDSSFVVDQILNEREACLKTKNDMKRNQPDAVLVFKHRDESKKGVLAIFLELERSYTSIDRLTSKLKGYYSSFSDGDYIKYLKLPIVGHRVLFVSQTQSQFDTICAKIEASDQVHKIEILIARYQEVCEHALERIYYTSGTDETFGLLSRIENKLP